jgi:hypothetical protein
MGLSTRWRFPFTASMVLLASILARPGGGDPSDPISGPRPFRAAARRPARQPNAEQPTPHAPGSSRTRNLERPAALTGEPEPYFSVTWTATAVGSSDVTQEDGTRVVAIRSVEISGSTVVRRFPDGSQDSYTADLIVTDDLDRDETYTCLDPGGGINRNHIRRSITDPERYQGTSPSVGPIFPPQQRPDGSWYLFDPFIQFYGGRSFTYNNNTNHVGCDGTTSVDSFDADAGFYADLAVPGDLEGGSEGITFIKQSSFVSPFSMEPPMNVQWSVIARKIADHDLTVERLEVTQGLQSGSNAIPLVRGRRTVVRAYLGVGKQEAPVLAVSGILRGWSGGQELGETHAFNPGREINAPRSPDWKNINDTLNFEVPFPWTLEPSLKLEVEVNDEHLVLEDNYNNNKLDTNVTLTDCQPVKIGYLRLHYNPPQGFNPSDPTVGVHVGQKFLQKVYPVASGDLRYELETGFTWPASVADGRGSAASLLLDVLAQRLLTTSLPRPDRLVAWLPAGASDINGRATMPGDSAWVVENTNPNYWRATLAHEVAHTYGRDHTGLTTGGRHWFDVSERKVQPANADGELFDFIFGVGHPEPERWVAPETYNFLFGKICSGASAQALEARSATVGDNLLVSGIVNNVAPPTGSLNPLYRTSTAPTHIPDPPAAGPGYCVKLKNVAGTVLAQYCFDVFFEIESTTPMTATSAPFALVVPYPAGLARVELTRGTNTVLNFRTPSANPPAVTLTYPNAPGLTLSGLQTVTWNASDPDGNPLTYSLLYSKDNGSTWTGIAAAITQTSYALDFSDLPGGAAARIRVQASDGFFTAEDDSDNSFTVGKKGPIVSIVSPPAGETFDAAVAVTLQATGTDLEDGSLGDGAFSWSSDRDGALGTGRLRESLLSVGSHVITLTGTDSDGQTATASVALTISGTPPPAPGFYTVTPCRVADTRDDAGPWGGPSLAAGLPRTFAIGGRCGVSPSAKAVSFNFTVTQPTAFGHLTVYPEGSNPPLVSAMNFRAGQTRANNAILALGPGGVLTVVSGQPSGTTHFIIDVNGYFE